MSDSENNEATPSPDSEQTLSGQPPTPQDSGATEERYGADAGFLAGKSKDEAVAWVNNLVAEVQQLVATKQPAAQPQPQPRNMQSEMPDPDLVLTDPKKYQEQLAGFLQQQQNAALAQAAGPVYAQLASQSRDMSKNAPENKDVWSKWGAEVEQMVANVPAHMRTRELYDQAVVMVRGRHVDEIATEKAQALAAAGTGLARANGGDAADTDSGDKDVWEKIESSPIGKATLATIGKKGILNGIRSGAYKSLEDYANYVAKSKAKVNATAEKISNHV